MGIKIIKEPDIHVTQVEYDRMHRDWLAEMAMTTAPVDFDTYVRRKKAAERSSQKGAGSD